MGSALCACSLCGSVAHAELIALETALKSPKRPLAAIAAGSKVSTKPLAGNLEQVNMLVVGGGIANTFIAALGHPVGKAVHET